MAETKTRNLSATAASARTQPALPLLVSDRGALFHIAARLKLRFSTAHVIMVVAGRVQVIAVKAPGFGERKTSYLEDIAILTGAQVIKDELGLTLDKVHHLHAGLPGVVPV